MRGAHILNLCLSASNSAALPVEPQRSRESGSVRKSLQLIFSDIHAANVEGHTERACHGEGSSGHSY